MVDAPLDAVAITRARDYEACSAWIIA